MFCGMNKFQLEAFGLNVENGTRTPFEACVAFGFAKGAGSSNCGS